MKNIIIKVHESQLKDYLRDNLLLKSGMSKNIKIRRINWGESYRIISTLDDIHTIEINILEAKDLPKRNNLIS